jgi:dienelactone hydrolase
MTAAGTAAAGCGGANTGATSLRRSTGGGEGAGGMFSAIRISLLAIGLASWLGAGGAGALVEFPNVSERGPATLVGYLARPDQGLSALLGGAGHSAERFPAVVVLHGCSGISSHSAGIADRLGSEGYVALAVDSLGPRGVASRCGSNGYPEQAFDAYSARRYLAQQGFVDAARIAVLGQSMGGIAVLYAVDRDMAAQYFTERFQAARPDKPQNRREKGDASKRKIDHRELYGFGCFCASRARDFRDLPGVSG